MPPPSEPAGPGPVLLRLGIDPADEFDLDLAWGDLTTGGGEELYLPTTREVPGETCDTHAGTCPDTCHGTCPATCNATCAPTCGNTCGGTCAGHATCRNTCDDTCHPCRTELQTHCFTCRSGCQTP